MKELEKIIEERNARQKEVDLFNERLAADPKLKKQQQAIKAALDILSEASIPSVIFCNKSAHPEVPSCFTQYNNLGQVYEENFKDDLFSKYMHTHAHWRMIALAFSYYFEHICLPKFKEIPFPFKGLATMQHLLECSEKEWIDAGMQGLRRLEK